MFTCQKIPKVSRTGLICFGLLVKSSHLTSFDETNRSALHNSRSSINDPREENQDTAAAIRTRQSVPYSVSDYYHDAWPCQLYILGSRIAGI